MTFCTFQTTTLIQKGTVVKKNNTSVTPNDNASNSVLVGIVIRSYSNEENTKYFAQVHLGGGLTYAKLGISWDGTFNAIRVNGDAIEPAVNGDYHGYLIPELPPIAKVAGDLVPIYWRGAT